MAHVYLAKRNSDNDLCAIKIINKKETNQRRMEAEKAVLLATHNPYIVTLHNSFQTDDYLCFVLKYYPGGEFYQYIKHQPNHCLTEHQTKFYSAEVLLGLEYLHVVGFIYRDLKPENILMDVSGHIVLTDFNLSRHSVGPLQDNDLVGTEEYIAPEVIRGDKQYEAIDWWTFGILLYEMAYGKTPFVGRKPKDTYNNICNIKCKFPDHHPEKVSHKCKELILALLKKNPAKRLGYKKDAKEIKNSPFYKKIKWDNLRSETPPIIPTLNNDLDTKYCSQIEDDWNIPF
jgi:protein-serine/threonine kinase